MCSMAGNETAREEPHRNLVTSGILRSSSIKDIAYTEIAETAALRSRETNIVRWWKELNRVMMLRKAGDTYNPRMRLGLSRRHSELC